MSLCCSFPQHHLRFSFVWWCWTDKKIIRSPGTNRLLDSKLGRCHQYLHFKKPNWRSWKQECLVSSIQWSLPKASGYLCIPTFFEGRCRHRLYHHKRVHHHRNCFRSTYWTNLLWSQVVGEVWLQNWRTWRPILVGASYWY